MVQTISIFAFIFLNLDNSVDIIYILFKFGVGILDIMMEGTVSQIFDLGLSSFLCDLENDFKKFCRQFPDFGHKMKTKK